ncbi:MAG: hypothetical protein AB1634_10135 [Thermodesulfobacteriota bacterium]
MASIDGHPIPDEITAELARLLAGLGEPVLRRLCQDFPQLAAGFRPKRPNLEVVRRRLAGLLAEGGELDAGLRGILAAAGLGDSLVAVLSRDCLAAFLSDLMALFGRAPLLTGLLADERAAVRELAWDELAAGPRPLADPETAQAALAGGLAPFLALVRERLLGEIPEPAPAGDSQELAALRARLASLEEERRPAGGSRMERRLQEKLARMESELAAARERLARERASRQELAAELAAARQAQATLENELQERIRQGVDEELAVRLRSWLAQPQAVAAEADRSRPAGTGDLLARARLALERQVQRDRHLGNRRQLAARLASLQQAAAELDEARQQALSPLPELAPLGREVQAEIRRLQAVLGEDPPPSPLVAELAARINSAAEDHLVSWRRLVEELAAAGILASQERASLEALASQTQARALDRARVAATPLPGVAGLVQRALDQGQPFHLVVDGHNVLFGLASLFGPAYDEHGVPGARARAALLAAVDRLLAPAGQALASVFFDGVAASEENVSPKVKAVYAAGGPAAEDRADQAILDYLDHCRPANGQVVLVSDDAALKKAAGRRQAQSLPLAAFAALLARP